MPSIFSHGIAAFALGKTTLRNSTFKVLGLGVLSSMVPDADTIAFVFGIPYESLWGHRGISHSFFFAVLWALLVMVSFFRKLDWGKEWWVLLLYFFCATASHPVLDAMTTGGLGVAFFAPFDNTRYFFPWRPIKVFPIGAKAFFSSKGLKVIQSELVWIWLPSLVLIFIFWRQKKRP
jgi:inner membrane protein